MISGWFLGHPELYEVGAKSSLSIANFLNNILNLRFIPTIKNLGHWRKESCERDSLPLNFIVPKTPLVKGRICDTECGNTESEIRKNETRFVKGCKWGIESGLMHRLGVLCTQSKNPFKIKHF